MLSSRNPTVERDKYHYKYSEAIHILGLSCLVFAHARLVHRGVT